MALGPQSPASSATSLGGGSGIGPSMGSGPGVVVGVGRQMLGPHMERNGEDGDDDDEDLYGAFF